jgi:predicted nucleic acid-binding protein
VIVVDANVMILALASPTDRGDASRTVLTGDDLWFAPAHMPLEVIRALRKAVVGGQLAEPDALAAFGALMAAEVTYVGATDTLLQAVWGMRHNVSAYDAAYLAVAAERGAQLVTFDARLAKAAEQVVPHVPVLMP